MSDLALTILESIEDGVFAVDRAGRVTMWNARLELMTGVARDAVVGHALFDVLPAWRDQAILIARAADGPIAAPFSVAGRRLDAIYSPLPDGVVVIVRDATGLAEELRESNERFEIMADTAPVLLWMAGTDSQCTYFNKRWLAFTGRPLAAELGTGWAEGVHAEDFQRCMDTYLDAFVARRTFQMEYRLRRADGEHRWLLDTGVPRWLASGAFAGYIGSCIDITDSRLLRDELDQRVRDRTAELEAFAYSVSHDLRTPLRSIEGFGRALLLDHGDQLDAKGQHYLERVRNAAKHMASLIDGLLHLSRIGRMELELGAVDLSAIAREVARALCEHEPERAVAIDIEDGITVHGDPQLLRIALDNLLGNAWKFTSKAPDARIAVGCVQREGKPVLVVRDNGVGFDMAYANRLFGAFQRLHRQSDFPGTGIGLATVQRIVSRHRGRIWAEAELDHGAAFYLSIP